MTPHNSAKKGEIAKVVIMPGDPLRAKWIAENYLEDCKLVNSVRGMLAFTGTYKGKEITVMGHGMGIPSIGIYSYELFKFYEADFIMRVGSAGAYLPEVKLGDVLIVDEAYSDSTYADELGIEVHNKILQADPKMVELGLDVAKKMNIDIKKVRCNSADVFYGTKPLAELVNKTKAAVVEMESFALFSNAKILNKKSLCLLTCSDSLVDHSSMPAIERQEGFSNMSKLALEIGIAFYDKYK
ncbi:MAG: purine-nucleoside phosphorylase [Mycoplasmoidaceae bacterium]